MDRLKELKAKMAAGTITVEEKTEMEKLEAEAAVTLDDVTKAITGAIKSGIAEIIKEHKAPGLSQEVKEKRSFREVVLGIKTQNKRIIDKYALVPETQFFAGEEKVLAEGGPTTGGYLVPVEYSNALIDLINEYSIIRKLATIWPMRGTTLNVPTVTNGVAAYWIDENGLKTESDPVFGNLALIAYKLCCITRVSDELLADSNPKVDRVLMNLFAKGMMRAEETAFLQGAAGVGDPITGIYNTAGITTIPFGADLLDDIADLIGAVEENEGENVTILHALREKRTLRKLKDDEGDYIYQKPAEKGSPSTIWDAAAIGDKYIPKNLGTGANESYMIAGDFSHAHIGDRQEIVIAVDTSRYFEYDQTAFRGVKRTGFKVDDPTKFARLTGIK